jgi:predicted ArsR family transcriptional regulator
MVGLHRNSARTHLDALVSVGLARRRIEQRTTRGRPRVLYENAAAPRDTRDAVRAEADLGYLDLSQLLAGQLTEIEDAASEAVRAGRRWAAVVDSSPLPIGCLTPVEAMGAVAGLFERLGFDPELALDEGRILLHRCPFVEVARQARPVICGMHLGMLKATLERLDAPLEVTGFHPFVEDDPLLCVVSVAERLSPRRNMTRQEVVSDADRENTGAAPRSVAMRAPTVGKQPDSSLRQP